MDNKISIIIPAYNIENYLNKTLDSVLAQTYSNLEIIVVNDGSKDGTGHLIDSYAFKDSRIKAIHKENGGVTSARLRGVTEATGDWIAFVDGDDYIEPQMYEKLMGNALNYGVDISHCGYQMVFPNRVDYYYNTGKLVQQDTITGLTDLFEGKFVEPGLWNKLYRRNLFSGLSDWMDSSIKINEDLLMNYYLFKHSTLSIYEDICPYHYILRKGSAATSKLNKHKLWDPLKVTQIIMEQADDVLQPVLLQRLTRQLISGASMSLSDQPELIDPYRSETRKKLRLLLGNICRSNCGTKLKISAFWVAIWPASYRWVHNIYAKVTGLDKIYDLD